MLDDLAVVAQLVERDLAKVEGAGSSPVYRSPKARSESGPSPRSGTELLRSRLRHRLVGRRCLGLGRAFGAVRFSEPFRSSIELVQREPEQEEDHTEHRDEEGDSER